MPTTRGATTRVTKKLTPEQRGALGWARKYGAALVCVRYRVDAGAGRRFTTVELLVDEAPLAPPKRDDAMVWLRIGVEEFELRERIKRAGARWEPARKLWRLPSITARRLGLQARVVRE